MKKRWLRLLGLLGLMLLITACPAKKDVRPELLDGPGYTKVDNNLHQIDGPAPDGQLAFRVYRSGAPGKETFAKWCGELGIKRAIVMSGDAGKFELAWQAEGVCPDVEVLYNEKQDHNRPVSDGFLDFYDQEIERARADGVGILARCFTGSHRAGRMAAYYQMKYQGLTADEAIAVMTYNGMMMPLFNIVLIPQVRAMSEYIHGEPCDQPQALCVKENSNQWMP
jgi:hypothetical protein